MMPHSARTLALFVVLISGCQGGQAAPAPGQPQPKPSDPAKPAGAPQVPEFEVVKFKMDGPPAVPQPAAEDQGWKSPSYDELAPSRPDGKPTFSNDWFDNNSANWKKHLGHLAGKENLHYLEVGVFEGQSVLWMFDEILTHPSSTAVGIDLFDFEGLQARFEENLQRAGIADRVETIKAFSNVGLRGLKSDSFDVIYIDASHTGANVLRDGILAWDLLKPGGILIFDDYALRRRYPAPIRPGPAIDMFVTVFYKELDVLSRGWQLMVKRKPTDCWDNCSTVGPYYYHWDYRNPLSVGTGTLYDPRTKARVPLTKEEATVIERWMRVRPIGSPDPVVRKEVWQSPAMQAVAKKLNLL